MQDKTQEEEWKGFVGSIYFLYVMMDIVLLGTINTNVNELRFVYTQRFGIRRMVNIIIIKMQQLLSLLLALMMEDIPTHTHS